jgi:glycosyltransferase involved in cell wall biosynthesis
MDKADSQRPHRHTAAIPDTSPAVADVEAGKRPAVAFVAWSSVPGRSNEIALALGGDSRCFYPLRIVRRTLVPLRYAISALQTIGYLARHRPRAVIVTNPPVFAALVAYPYARLARAPLLLDSHPDAFRRDGPHSPFLGLHAWLARRARATLVTTDELAGQVRAWGGTAAIVHEPPPAWTIGPTPTLVGRPTVIVLGSLSPDEAVDEALAAARELSDVDFVFTGDTRRCPDGVVASAPENVDFVGLLSQKDYAAALERASVAVVLTTWLRYAVPRSAYDAVYARRPLVLSDSPLLRELFPFAVKVDNDRASIAAGVRAALAQHDDLVGTTAEALTLQRRRWAAQLEGLRELVATR